MWMVAPIFFLLLAGGCSVYEGVQGTSGGAAGATNEVTAGGDTTRTSGSGGEAGTDSGGARGAATGSGGVSNGSGGGGGTVSSGVGGSGGVASTGGAGGSVGTGGVGGMSGRGGAAGGSATGGSGGATGSSDAGRDAAAVCQPGTCKRIFVSLNVPVRSGRLGGTTATDAFCQSAADAIQLGGTWKAWLSDSGSSPSTRFTHSTVPYRLLDGSLIASNWNSLTNGTIDHAINIFEDRTPVPPSVVLEVWTGTTTSGTYSGNSCSNWTNDTMNSSTADVGLTNQVGTGWTDIYRQYCNRTTLHVYCFEQ